MLYGVNAVVEALAAGRRRVREIFLLREAGTSHEPGPAGSRSRARETVEGAAREAGVPIREVDAGWLASRFPSREDQGVAALAAPYPYTQWEHLIARAKPPALFLALDQVQDPRNLGAVARSVAAFGASGLVIHKDRSASVTPAAVKTSTGMTERIAIARVTNLARAIGQAREAGVWIRGLDATAKTRVWDEDLTLPTLIVTGGEDSGLRRLTADLCDSLLCIPIARGCNSLNAATAASVTLAEASRQRAVRGS